MVPMTAIKEALALLPKAMDSAKARVMMIAIGLQESRFLHRRQLVGNPPKPTGPAAGYWQFERMGGVNGVLTHRATSAIARVVCERRKVRPTPMDVWEAMQHDDVLAAAFARLLLYSDPKPLPELGEDEAAWDLYTRVWRPGKPHRSTWSGFYEQAMKEASA